MPIFCVPAFRSVKNYSHFWRKSLKYYWKFHKIWSSFTLNIQLGLPIYYPILFLTLKLVQSVNNMSSCNEQNPRAFQCFVLKLILCFRQIGFIFPKIISEADRTKSLGLSLQLKIYFSKNTKIYIFCISFGNHFSSFLFNYQICKFRFRFLFIFLS